MAATTSSTVHGSASGEGRIGVSTGKAIAGAVSAGPPVEDTVEPSPAGIALPRAEPRFRLPTMRISDIRAEIRAGTFVTPERLRGTVERLLDILG